MNIEPDFQVKLFAMRKYVLVKIDCHIKKKNLRDKPPVKVVIDSVFSTNFNFQVLQHVISLKFFLLINSINDITAAIF